MNQLFWDGRIVPHINSRNFGAIKDGHTIRLGKGEELTPWDTSFESLFDKVDSDLPKVVKWVEQFKTEAIESHLPFAQRLKAITASDTEIDALLESMLSLVVRSPRYRNGIGLFIGAIHGRQHTRKDQTLINLNLHHAYERLQKTSGRGKMLLLKSTEKEFIFGDGFFNNYISTSQTPSNAKIILPLTPCTAVMFVRPRQYLTEPRLGILNLDESEVDFINYFTQVYSCDFVFYRSQKPQLTNDFTCHRFLDFECHQHPWIEELTSDLAKRFG